MKRCLALLALAPLAAGCTAALDGGGAPPAYPGELDPAVRPTFQSMQLELDPAREVYSGSVRVEIEAASPAHSFRFHAADLELGRTALTGAAGKIDLTLERGEEGLVVATPADPLAPGAYTLEIDFTATYGTRAVGLYRIVLDERSYLFTQFEAIDARTAFPCWDEPAFKIPYQLTLRVPEGQEAITNTPVESESSADGWRTLSFARTRPLPSYLLAIAVGPFDTVPIPGLSVPGRVVAVHGQAGLAGLAVELTPPVLAALERYFGRPYPYEKLDLIAVPEFWPGAMENPGAVTFADSLLLVAPDAAGVDARRRLVSVTAHELAHMWFGDLVTMSWWDDLWLNESFASWLGDKVTERLHPEYAVDVGTLRRTQRVMSRDARPSTKPIRKPVRRRADIMEGLALAYAKGETVLRMVEGWIGPEVFRAGVLDYVEAHAWGNARAADLWGALSAASGRDVARVMSGFLDQPGYPMLQVELEPDGGVRLRQRRFLHHGVTAPPLSWTLPVRLKLPDGSGTTVREVLLDGPEASLRLDGPVAWVLPDAGASGYYRWVVPDDALRRLAGVGQPALDVRERVAFLGNAGALLDAGEIRGDLYLELLGALSADPSPEVVTAVVDGLDKVRDSFVPDELRGQFAAYVVATLRPALERFGLEPSEGEAEAVTLFRPRLVAWLGEEGRDPDVRQRAQALARTYMKRPAAGDPSLNAVALQVAALDGDRERFETYRARFESAATPAERRAYLGALGSFDDPGVLRAALDYAIRGPVRTTELFTLLRGVPDTEAARQQVYDWATENFERIRERVPADEVIFLPILAGGCSGERLAHAQEFFGAHDVDGMDSTLARVADQVHDCVELREREGAAVGRFLRSLG